MTSTAGDERPVALVVGGSRGIGRATALALGRRGVRVGVLARSRRRVAEVVRDLRDAGQEGVGLVVDATDADRVEQAVAAVRQQWDRLDVLVHAAGIYPDVPLAQCSLAEWNRVLATNLTSAFLATRAVVPCMVEQHSGTVVLIGSAHVTRPRARPDREAYYASKGGLVGLAAGLRASYEAAGVRTVVVHPGWTVDGDAPAEPERQLTAGDVAEVVARVATSPGGVHVRDVTVTARDG